ncbi:MAG TPA: choice-of-anchor Q domain-containing protein [Thermoleophilaceae bacterium]
MTWPTTASARGGHRRSHWLVGLLAGAALLWIASPAAAAVITVNTATDNHASVGECSGAAGDCSLRQAIDKAVAGVDTVQIPASIPLIQPLGGPVTITKDVTIAGTGSGANAIDGQNAVGLFSITGSRTVTFTGLSLINGKASSGAAISAAPGTLTLDGVTVSDNTSGGSNVSGSGAVTMSGGGHATIDIENSTFSFNHVGGGGTAGDGFGVVGESGTGTDLVVRNSVFSGNNVGGGGGDGDGVLSPSPGGGVGTVDVSDSTFTGNVLGGGGGVGSGIIRQTSITAGSSITVTGSTFNGNTLGGGAGAASSSGSGSGGGIEANFSAAGNLTVENSSFTGNTLGGAGADGTFSGSGLGGGVDATFTAGGSLKVNGSTFSDNTLGGSGSTGVSSGAGFGGGLELAFSSSSVASTASITNNTFVGNTVGGAGGSAQNGGLGLGGGFELTSAGKVTATISGNTISANRAGGNGSTGTNTGNGLGGGAEISLSGLTDNVSLVDNTIVDNIAGGAAGSGSTSGEGLGGGVNVDEGTITFLNDTIDGNVGGSSQGSRGGGVEASTGASTLITFKNTIVSGNTAAGLANNCAGAFASGGHNIEGTAPSQCGFGAAGDRVGVDPLLAAPGANGGSTLTQALLPGSPAIGGGDNSGCATTDQRGIARPQGGVCDVGAFEVATPVAITGAASKIKTTSATLGGSAANPDLFGGGSVHFDFGTSSSYGSQTAPQAIGGPAGTTAFAASVSKLKPNTLYHFREVVTNPEGTSAGGDRTFRTASPAPRLSRLGLKPSKLVAAAGRGPSLTAAKTGAKVSYRDSLAATTTFTVQVKRSGFRSGKRCVAKRPSHGKAKRCTLFKSLGSFRHKDKAGKNSFHFTGRARHKALAVGRYRLQAVARKSGAKSRKALASFRIVSG